MSLYKRPGSPHWWTQIQVNGHRVRRSTETSARRAAEKFERELKDQLKKQSSAAVVGTMSLDQACGRYWMDHGHARRDAKDVQRWLRYVLKYIDPQILLSDLSGRHVADFVSAMRADGIGEISINRTVTTLQGVHNRAAKVWEEPVKVIGWKPHKTPEKGRENWITQDQARTLLDALPIDTRALVWFMLCTGIRRREAFELSWDRVDTHRGVITIEAKGGVVREVDLSPEARLILAEQPRETDLVFDTTNYRKRFDRAKADTGLATLRWHDLRHTCATWLGQSGAPLDVIRQQLGHSSIVVTQKYRHVDRPEVRAALSRMPDLRAGGGKVLPLKKPAPRHLPLQEKHTKKHTAVELHLGLLC